MNEKAAKQHGINSVEVGLRVLKEIVALGRPAQLREVALAAEMHPAKVHRYLVSWVRGGLVEQDPNNGRYDLGPYAIELGLACLARIDAVKVGAEGIDRLATEIDEPVFLAVWNNNRPTVVDWHPAQRQFSPNMHLGSTFSLLQSSTGHVFAAYLPPRIVDPLIDQELEELSDDGSTNLPRTREEVNTILSEVRERRMARGLGIRRRGIHSLSAPAFDHMGAISCVVTAFGYEDTFDSSWRGPIAVSTRALADQISRQLGYESQPKPSLVSR